VDLMDRIAAGLRGGALAVAGVTAAALLAGCGGASDSGAGRAADAGRTAPAARSASPAGSTTPAAPGAPTGSGAHMRAAPEGYDPSRNAAADIAAAEKAAAKDGRPVLIDFGADWCPDCVVLGRTFTEPDTAALLDRYHVVRVDVGEFDHNLDVASRYVDLQASGIPALAVVDAHGRTEVATNQGEFSNARDMPVSAVNAFLKKWA
jgi:thioredoxin 1